MVTITKKKKHKRKRSIPLKILDERGQKILKEKGPIIDVGISLYLVQSMSTESSYHDVRYLSGVWSCNCAYYRTGHTRCKHICAVRATLLMREEASRIVKTTHVETPKIRCPRCKQANFHESTTYDTRRGKATVYLCDNICCKHRFTWRPGFKKKWFSDDMITDVLVDAATGHPPYRIRERLGEKGISISERTIQRWIDEYSVLMEGFASALSYQTGNRWSLDEKYIKTHPDGSKKKHWLVAALDNTTGLILGYEVSDTKFGYDATNLLTRIVDNVGRVPDVIIADKLKGYKKGFENAIKSRNPSAVLVADAGINGKHIHNNKRERMNGEFKDCMSRSRGFNSLVPGLVRIHILYHNFIHKTGSSNVTPAEAAGVIVAGPDRFKTLIQNAALATA